MHTRSSRIRALLFATAVLPAAFAPLARAQAPEPKAPRAAPADDAIVAEERIECDRIRRRGDVKGALRRIDELLDEHPQDVEALVVRALCRFDQSNYAAALKDTALARDAAGKTPALALALRTEARILTEVGRAGEAVDMLEKATGALNPAVDARDAWALGSAAWTAGRRATALRVLASGAGTGDDQTWDGVYARGLCQHRLGNLEDASKSFVLSLNVAKAAANGAMGSDEPDVLAALGDLYFEADKEVEAGKSRSATKLYREALDLHPTHEAALLGLFALHRYNWQLQRESAADIMNRALAARPNSILTLLAAAAADLDDGQQKNVHARLEILDTLAPKRREVRTLHATLAWIEHDADGCARILKELAAEDPLDATPEREVGRHLLELYRFAEGLPFVRRACERDPNDYEALTQLGRALANTGDEDGARRALESAQKAAAGRQDAWRDNTRLVLKRLQEHHQVEKHGDLTFSWDPDGGEVLATYLVPFYENARVELAKRYGFTPEPTRIEVFRAHKDFSVRSTGFEGFPALGVCFGPVVTAVSPLWEMRGTQSWARTSFHEFTHVIHLGLSHNRCPRWITEGLATWEEVNRNPAWTRNMRRELVDSIANGQVIPVRDLNRAFRGPRILFGYYQGGLMCQLLIERFGFARIVAFLEAFDRGLDLDAALKDVYSLTPEELDADFLAFVSALTRDLRIEPRWDPARVSRIQLGLASKMPADPKQQSAWIDAWCTVAWSGWQRGKKLDAQEALRHLKDVQPEPARALFLRGSIALSEGDRVRTAELYEAAIARGGEDYRARIALASFAKDDDKLDVCEKHLLAAEKAFPGYDDPDLSAEKRLAELYYDTGRKDEAMAQKELYLAWNAGEVKMRLDVAAWHIEHGRPERALALFAEANEVDPFLRRVHRSWADALRAAGKFEDALREYRMTLLVPPQLDADEKTPFDATARAELLGLQAACLQALGRKSEAIDRAKEALVLDSACAIARETLEKVQ